MFYLFLFSVKIVLCLLNDLAWAQFAKQQQQVIIGSPYWTWFICTITHCVCVLAALDAALEFQQQFVVPGTWKTEVKEESSSSEDDDEDEEEEQEEDASGEEEEVESRS